MLVQDDLTNKFIVTLNCVGIASVNVEILIIIID